MRKFIHEFAVEVAKLEGGKKQVDIAQIKQVLFNAFTVLAKGPIDRAVKKERAKWKNKTASSKKPATK